MAVEIIRDYTGRGETRASSLRIPSGAEGLGATRGEAVGRQSFAEMVKGFAADVNDLQFQASHAIDLFVTGEAADVHQVMVAVEQASIALDLMLEIRNRVLEGYQELMRMQV